MNLIDACIEQGVKRVVALSTDKACSPSNLYVATKLTSDKLFIAGNSYSGGGTAFAVVRYGNVMGSCGSVIPFFLSLADKGVLPITDTRMTRFLVTLEQSVNLVWHAFEDMIGGEIYVKKIPLIKLLDIALACAPDAKIQIIGIRPGEKLHEQMIGKEDVPYTYEFIDNYKVLPSIHKWSSDPSRINGGTLVAPDFTYCSENNSAWMSIASLQLWIKKNRKHIDKI